MNLIKHLYLKTYWQFRVRLNLYRLRDLRTFLPFLDAELFEAAKIWPEVLPWKPRTIFDVGAHRGEIAGQLSKLYNPLFICIVEPIPQMADFLRNKVFAPQQKVFACALGRSESQGVLNVLASMPSSSLLEVTPGCDVLFRRSMERVDTIKVPVRMLDNIFEECGLKDLDLLKIDVQGYEIEVFSGGTETLRKTRLVVVEVSFFEHYKNQPLFGEVYNFLHIAGFELRSTFGYIYDTQGLPLQCDAVFINRAMPYRK